jgi:hypothetical protein
MFMAVSKQVPSMRCLLDSLSEAQHWAREIYGSPADASEGRIARAIGHDWLLYKLVRPD